MLRFLAGAEPVRVLSAAPRGRARDEAAVAIEFANGSIGIARLHRRGRLGLGKERLEVFAGGASFVLDDYKSLEVHGLAKDGLKTRTIEKGQKEQLENFYRALRGEASLGVTAEDGLQATWCAEMAMARRSHEVAVFALRQVMLRHSRVEGASAKARVSSGFCTFRFQPMLTRE